jgi:hypothetical protein
VGPPPLATIVSQTKCRATFEAESDAPIASAESADRKRELAFRGDSFMFFGDTLDAVARVAGIPLRGGNEMENFIGTRG